MSLTFILTIIFIHWVADFVLQTHEQAINKSSNNFYLTQHVLSYTFTWIFAFALWMAIIVYGTELNGYDFGHTRMILWFFPITFVAHWITDYFTSRLNSYLHKKGDIHNFFVSVGFDQVLHYVQLFGTIWILT